MGHIMKTVTACLAYVLLTLFLYAPAMAIQLRGNSYSLSDDEMRACQSGGGCVFITTAQLQLELHQLQEQAWADGARQGGRAGYAAGYEAGVRAKGKGSI